MKLAAPLFLVCALDAAAAEGQSLAQGASFYLGATQDGADLAAAKVLAAGHTCKSVLAATLWPDGSYAVKCSTSIFWVVSPDGSVRRL